MEGMFIQCTQLKDLEFYFDLEKDVNMFNECDEQLKKKVIKLNKKNKTCNIFKLLFYFDVFNIIFVK